LALGLSLLALSVPTWAQTAATVTVNAGTTVGTIPTAAFGVNTAVWDGNLLDSSVPGLLSQAGVTALRFPGGSTADVYHWQNNSATAGTGQYINSSDTFDAFVGVAQKAGATPVITVNYGSNAAGNAGGDPNEAASWVNYANNTKKYGIKYWEVGNEIYGNGEYGSAWEEDLHSDHSPTAYGNNVVSFVNAMKAQDPTIKVGAVLTAPGAWPDGQSPDWNSNVLAACGSKIDFVIVHWYAQEPGSESDSGLLSSTSKISGMVTKLKSLISQYCGSNAPNVQIFVTETNSVSYNPGKQTVGLVNALFLADDYMDWLEGGAANVDWWDLHNGPMTGDNNSSSLYGSANYGDYGLLSVGQSPEPAAETPVPAYYGLQILTDLGKSGDSLVSATSNQSLLAVHAVKQANGNLALLLINKDPSNSYAANVSISGYTPAGASTVYTYGKSSSSITSASGTAGANFVQTVPPYSLITVVLKPSSGSGGSGGSGNTTPTFSAKASASPSTVAPGAASAISATVTDTGAALSNSIVDLEVYNSAGTKVSQNYFTGQNFTAGGSNSYSWNWTAPSAAGVYTVEVGVFDSTWGTNYYWNGNAATITVAASDSAQYSFESGAQGWTSSGSPITGVSSSTTQAFAGTHALAVAFNGGAGTAQAYVSSPTVAAGKTVTFHVWIPAGSAVSAVQPYVQQGSGGGWTWTGNYQAISNLQTGAWNTLTVTVPSNAVTPLYQLGVQFFTNATWSGTCYIDTISW
jgi:hypothetical protein